MIVGSSLFQYELNHFIQVEDVLNKKKPPPQILDLNGKDIDANHHQRTEQHSGNNMLNQFTMNITF